MKSKQSGFGANAAPLVCVALGICMLTGCAVHRSPVYSTGLGVEMFAARESGVGLVERGLADEPHPAARTFGPSPVSGEDPSSNTPIAGQRQSFHIDFGLRVSYTLLRETKKDLDRWLHGPLKTDVLGIFDSPQTPLDRRSDLGLATLYLGLGSETDDCLVWTVYVGGGVGDDHDHQRLANLNLEVDFEYLHVYTGVMFELYPWGKPAVSSRPGFVDGLKASRPYILAGLEVGYVDTEGRGHYSVAPIRLNEHRQTNHDWLVSNLVGLGWAIPMSDRWAFNVSTHYAFHYYRPDEYNSWVVTTALRYRF